MLRSFKFNALNLISLHGAIQMKKCEGVTLSSKHSGGSETSVSFDSFRFFRLSLLCLSEVFPSVSILYHRFFQVSIWNVVQIALVSLLQNADFSLFAQIHIDILKNPWYDDSVGCIFSSLLLSKTPGSFGAGGFIWAGE